MSINANKSRITDLEDFDQFPLKEPIKRYIILSMQRTGSYYISRRLCNIKNMFGIPSEYFHPKSIEAILPRLMKPFTISDYVDSRIALNDYLKYVERARTTDDGYFGIKVQPHQLQSIFNGDTSQIIDFISDFDKIILLTRQDKLAQAISVSKAICTNEWFDDHVSFDLQEKDLKHFYSLIASNISRFIEEEELLLMIKKKIGKKVLHISYEDLERDNIRIFNLIIEYLSNQEKLLIEEIDSFTEVPKKNNSDLTAKIKKGFIKYISQGVNDATSIHPL